MAAPKLFCSKSNAYHPTTSPSRALAPVELPVETRPAGHLKARLCRAAS